jgi:hypothetical protein
VHGPAVVGAVASHRFFIGTGTLVSSLKIITALP